MINSLSTDSLLEIKKFIASSVSGGFARVFEAFILIEKGYFMKAEALLSQVPEDQTKLLYCKWILTIHLLINQNRFENARVLCKKVRQISEKNNEPILTRFLDLFEASIDIRSEENIIEGIRKLDDLVRSLPDRDFRRIRALAIENIAFGYFLTGNFTSSVLEYKIAQDSLDKIGDIYRSLKSRFLQAMAKCLMGDFTEAKKMVDDAMIESRVHGFDYGIYFGTLIRANIFLKIGQLDLASFENSLFSHISEDVGSQALKAFYLFLKGQINFMHGKYEMAEENYQKALDLVSMEKSRRLRTEILFHLILAKLKINKTIDENQKLFEATTSAMTNHPQIQLFSIIIQHIIGIEGFDRKTFFEIINRTEIPQFVKLNSLFTYVDNELDKIHSSGHCDTNLVLQISDILEEMNNFAQKESSVLHKVLYLLLKAKFHAIELNYELLEPTLQLVEGFIQEYGLNHFRQSVAKIRQMVATSKEPMDFQNEIFQDVGFAEDFFQIYDFDKSMDASPIAFIISNDEGIELLNIPIQNNKIPQIFISGLLYGIKLISYFWKETTQRWIELEGFTLLFDFREKLEFWMVVKGCTCKEMYAIFHQVVDEILLTKVFDEANIITSRTEQKIRDRILDLFKKGEKLNQPNKSREFY